MYGSSMASPQPMGALKRPPFVKNISSSSSLDGLEQAIPSFQSFIKRTPPLDGQKPLPPTPLIPRRASSSSPPRSRASSTSAARRTSSVYSRTVSQWVSDDISWRSADFADEPLPPVPVVQTVPYSASTPHLGEQQPTPPVLQPRTYSPLLKSPSPPASRVSTPSPHTRPKLSALLTTPAVAVQPPKKHLQTISLEKAKAAVLAPGAEHLLPEELRAKMLGKTRSQEPLRVTSFDIMAGRTPLGPPPQIPGPPILVDDHGRQRTLNSPVGASSSAFENPFSMARSPTKTLSDLYGVEQSPGTLMASTAHHRIISRDKEAQVPAIGDADELRGRPRYRNPKDTDASQYNSNNAGLIEKPSTELERTHAQMIAENYQTLVAEQHRQPSNSPGYHGTDSDDSVKGHMKMVPRPLFENKPPAKLPGSVSGRGRNPSVSPYALRDDDRDSLDAGRRSSSSNRGRFPIRLSLTSGSTRRGSSTSGSIPISPPESGTPTSSRRSLRPSVVNRKPKPHANDKRVSAFYPHVAPRKGKKGKAGASKGPAPPMPLLSVDIIAQRLHDPQGVLDASPLTYTQDDNVDSSTYRSNSMSHSDKAPLYHRMAKGAAKYADLLTRPTELPARRYEPITAATVAPRSPHLLPSPVKSHQVHLGWSDVAKSTFDKSRGFLQSSLKSPVEPEAPRFIHTAAPARPLDDSKAALGDVDSPGRKGSVFGGMFEVWKESKAEKRREELKKSIRVVPRVNGTTTPSMKRRSSAFAWT